VKDQSIVEIVKWLEAKLNHHLLMVDHWDADMFAVGIARPGSPSQLVYISTWNCHPDRYIIELEASPASDSNIPYATGGTARGH
jgi:hypothetical protein